MEQDKQNLQHDRFYRKVFSKKANLVDLLNNSLPQEYREKIDFDTIELSKESFMSEKLSSFWSDMVVNAKMSDKDIKITLLIEHKANYDRFTLLQMLKYLVHLWDDEVKNNISSLTPVIPILIFHGKSEWDSNRDMTMCFDKNLDDLFKRFIPTFDYILFDLNQVEDDKLIGNIEYMASIRVMKYIHKNLLKVFREVLTLLSEYLKTNNLNENLKSFLDTLIEYISKSEEIEPDNVNDIIDTVNDNELKEVLMTLEKKLELKGKEEGREEEKREIAKRMKKDGIDVKTIEKYTGLTKEEIEKL